jgi:predicted PP-loop superfamily ATPase
VRERLASDWQRVHIRNVQYSSARSGSYDWSATVSTAHRAAAVAAWKPFTRHFITMRIYQLIDGANGTASADGDPFVTGL